MNANRQEILEAALRLSEKERVLLADELLESIPADGDDVDEEDPIAPDDAWAEELERRLEDVRQGKAKTVTWDELKQME